MKAPRKPGSTPPAVAPLVAATLLVVGLLGILASGVVLWESYPADGGYVPGKPVVKESIRFGQRRRVVIYPDVGLLSGVEAIVAAWIGVPVSVLLMLAGGLWSRKLDRQTGEREESARTTEAREGNAATAPRGGGNPRAEKRDSS